VVNGTDPRTLLARLGVREVVSVVPATGGRDTAVWRVEAEGGPYALRFFAPGREQIGRHEAEVMRAARTGGVPAPRVLAEEFLDGRAVMLMTWCPGRPVAAELQRRPWRAYPLGVLFGRCQARLNALPAPGALRGPERSWLAWLPPEEGALRAGLARLPHREDRLLHLDYHPLNVLTDGRRITGIVDWTNARSGDPRADIARTLTILRLDIEPAGVPRPVIRAVVRAFELGWRRGYAQVAGREGEGMAPYNAWAGAVMERDLLPRLDVPGGLSPGQMARIRVWTRAWTIRAGLD
jgi:aminoglycoside phosphotransferase (APT) family kinase protein